MTLPSVSLFIVISGSRHVRYHLTEAGSALEARRRVRGYRGRRLVNVRAIRMLDACQALRAAAKAKGVWV